VQEAPPEVPEGIQAGDKAKEGSEEPESAGKAPKPVRDLSKLKDTVDLQKALHADFRVQPQQALKELNIERWTDLAISLPDAYKKIAKVR